MNILKYDSFPFLKQISFMECGPTSLAIILKYYTKKTLSFEIAQLSEVTTEGTTLFKLNELAEDFGFDTEAYKLEYDNLSDITLPCIVHYQGNHFVVVYRVNNKYVYISDPAIGKYRLKKEEFIKRWNGITLELEPTEDISQGEKLQELIQARKKRNKYLFKNFYLPILKDLRKSIKELLVASFIVQLLSISLPVFTQVILDQAVTFQSIGLLNALIISMVTIFIIQSSAEYIKQIFLLNFKIKFDYCFLKSLTPVRAISGELCSAAKYSDLSQSLIHES